MGSTPDSILQVLSASVYHDQRKALTGKDDHEPKTVRFLNRSAVVVMGIIGYIAMLAAPPALLYFICIFGTGTLQAAMAGPVFVDTLWRGNAIGVIASMLGGAATAALLLLYCHFGWVVSPLFGDVVGIVLYVL